MNALRRLQARLYLRLTERTGQSMAEYALILGAIAVVVVVAYQTIGQTVLNIVIDEVVENL